jgi:CheY-like chemotaxis protein
MAATPKRVLVVDDALDIARLLRSALGAADPDLVINVFPSAEEAIFASAPEPVHLLISDIRLPGISGADLVRRIRAANPGVKVILITGLNEQQINAHINGLEVDGLFNKPFEVTEFVEMAQRCLLEAAEVFAEQEKPIPCQDFEPALRELQTGLNAGAAWLYDRTGVFLAGTDDLAPDGKFVVSALPDQAAAASLLGSACQQCILTLRGVSADLVLAASDQHFLALSLPKTTSALRLALAVEEVQRTLAVIAAAQVQPVASHAAVEVVQQALAPQAAVEVAPSQLAETEAVSLNPEPEFVEELEPETNMPGEVADLSELVSLLDGEIAPAAGADVDAFWETAAGAADSPPPSQTISYEEAIRLGITPDASE